MCLRPGPPRAFLFASKVPLGTEDHTWMMTWGRAAPWVFHSFAKTTIELIAEPMTDSVTLKKIRKAINPSGDGSPGSVSEDAMNTLLEAGRSTNIDEPARPLPPGTAAAAKGKAQAKSKASKAQAKGKATAKSAASLASAANSRGGLGNYVITEKVPLGGDKYRTVNTLDIIFEIVNMCMARSIASADETIKSQARVKKSQLISQAIEFIWTKKVTLSADDGEVDSFSSLYMALRKQAQSAQSCLAALEVPSSSSLLAPPPADAPLLPSIIDRAAGSGSSSSPGLNGARVAESRDEDIFDHIWDNLADDDDGDSGGGAAALDDKQIATVLATDNITTNASKATEGGKLGRLMAFVTSSKLTLPLRFQRCYQGFESVAVGKLGSQFGVPKKSDSMCEMLFSIFSESLGLLVEPMWCNLGMVVCEFADECSIDTVPGFAANYFTTLQDAKALRNMRVQLECVS